MLAWSNSANRTANDGPLVAAIVTKTPAAYHDLDGIASYIHQRNPGAAHRFLKAAEHAFALLASQSLLGEAYPHPQYSDLRFWKLGHRFRNYVVFYRPLAEGIEIVRVLHGARDLQAVFRGCF
jgi:toxin ParE1/3/4